MLIMLQLHTGLSTLQIISHSSIKSVIRSISQSITSSIKRTDLQYRQVTIRFTVSDRSINK